MIKITNEDECCGCAACSVSCPQKCITMKPGTLGALFPSVNEAECISCGRCDAVCPMKKCSSEEGLGIAYAAYSKDDELRKRGSSGGMFETFAHNLFIKGYTVYGAAFDENLRLSCTSAQNAEQLFPLTKSKYLQSDLSGKYKEIESKLKNGENILFVSTPCQVLALKKYMNKEFENLITVDFFCHGAPSQKFFDEAISYEEKKLGGKILKYIFREKKKGGSTPHYYSLVYTKNGEKHKYGPRFYFDSAFYAIFQKYINLRESCYDCFFATQQRFSDITIGDFHDIDKYVKGINRFDGVSTVIINSQKGNRLFEDCKPDLKVFPLDLNTLIADGVCFAGGTPRPKDRDEFVKMYEEESFEELVERFVSSKSYIKNRIYYRLPKMLKKIIKRIC